jgi:ribose transport system ATP-binding protein
MTVSAGRAGERAAAPALEARHVSKTFAGNRVLADLDLTIAPGEIRALLGGNGSGKSTMIKILSGYHRPDPGAAMAIGGQPLAEGDAQSARQRGARFVHQELGLINASSVLDNLALTCGIPTVLGTVRGRKATQRARHILAAVGLDLDPARLVETLSPAERTGVALAAAVHGVDDGLVRLLVLDEPTATLPAYEVSVLLSMIRRVADRGIGVLYVTHRLDEVFQLGARVTVLRSGRHVITTDSSSLDHAALVHYLVGSELDEVSREAAAAPLARQAVLAATGIRSDRLAGISFEIGAGEVVGVSGVTGSGREAVAATIFGALPRDGGTIRIRDRDLPPGRPDASIRQGIGYLPADRRESGSISGLTARENLTLPSLASFWRGWWLRNRPELDETASWFERLQVKPAGGYDEPFYLFSGGNQQKLLFGKWLRLKPQLLLLDEPTQGVDVGAKAEIHHQILNCAASGTAVLVSSSDIDELAALCHRVLIIRDGQIAVDLRGDQVTVATVTRESLISDASHTLDDGLLAEGEFS